MVHSWQPGSTFRRVLLAYWCFLQLSFRALTVVIEKIFKIMLQAIVWSLLCKVVLCIWSFIARSWNAIHNFCTNHPCLANTELLWIFISWSIFTFPYVRILLSNGQIRKAPSYHEVDSLFFNHFWFSSCLSCFSFDKDAFGKARRLSW